MHYQQQLQQNLIYLATWADEEPDLQPMVFTARPLPPQPNGANDNGGAEAAAAGEEEAEAAAAGAGERAESAAPSGAGVTLEGMLAARGVVVPREGS